MSDDQKNKRLPTPFQGEMMVCYDCGKKQWSNPHVESNWTAIDIDDERIFICPKCWGKMNGYRLQWLKNKKQK